jgi:hypothetical protein
LVLTLVGAAGWAALRTGGATSSDTAGSGTAESSTSADDAAGGSAAREPAEQLAAALPERRDSGADYADPAQRTTALRQALPDASAGRQAAQERSATPFDTGEAETSRAPSATALSARASPAAPLVPQSADPLARLRDPAALAACLAALGPGRTAVAVDYARYGAAPAVAVLRPTADARTVSLTVVGAGCSTGDPDVLLSTTVTTPG